MTSWAVRYDVIYHFSIFERIDNPPLDKGNTKCMVWYE